ncbi:diguanylate cyclase [Haloimpatiens sp. FM7315]|uniref:diguanylate cyclase n=1 Tax=Haloimpatiens sp. FM7315 TaxID=3298609 RepID=UPI00370B8CF8
MSIKKKFRFLSIRNKLIICMIFLIIMPNIFIMNHVSSEFNKYLENLFFKRTKEDMVRIDNLINMYLGNIKENISFLSNNTVVTNVDNNITKYINCDEITKMMPSKSRGIEKQIYNLYSEFGHNSSVLKYIYMGTKDGGFIQWPEGYISKNYDPRERPWYKEAISKPGQTVITSPYYYPGANETVISIVKTIKNSKNEIVGVQGIDLNLQEITSMVNKMKIGKNGYIILTNSKGVIIANPNDSTTTFKNFKELKGNGPFDIEKVKSGVFTVKLDGNEKLINVYSSEKSKLKLISVIEKSEFLEQVDKVEMGILKTLLIFIIIALFMAIFFSNRFSKPILDLKKHLSYISYGNLKRKIPNSVSFRNDEFGELSSAIESMQNRLETLINAIRGSEKELKENVYFFQVLIDTIPSPIFSKDENGKYTHCNASFMEYLGLSKRSIIGNSDYEIYPQKLTNRFKKIEKNLIKNKGKLVYESQVKYSDDTIHDVIFNEAAIVNTDDEVKGFVGVILDITKERENQDKIKKLLKLKEVMIEIGHYINEEHDINNLFKMVLKKVYKCINVGSAGTLLILDDENILKVAVAENYLEEEVKSFSVNLEKSIPYIVTKGNIKNTVIANEIDKMNINGILKPEDGRDIKSVICAPIFIKNKLYGFINLESKELNSFGEREFELMEYVRYQLAITISKHELYEETIYLSRYDKLTGLFNRSYFEQLVYTKVYQSMKLSKKLYVAIFDLNGLKFVNDNYGHLSGDEFIRYFSKGLKKYGNDYDIIARFGGDEFIGVFYNTSLDKLTSNFDDLNLYFNENPIIFDKQKYVCSFSYGIASYNEDGNDFTDLVKIADDRMYKLKKIMKSNGKNCMKKT